MSKKSSHFHFSATVIFYIQVIKYPEDFAQIFIKTHLSRCLANCRPPTQVCSDKYLDVIKIMTLCLKITQFHSKLALTCEEYVYYSAGKCLDEVGIKGEKNPTAKTFQWNSSGLCEITTLSSKLLSNVLVWRSLTDSHWRTNRSIDFSDRWMFSEPLFWKFPLKTPHKSNSSQPFYYRTFGCDVNGHSSLNS